MEASDWFALISILVSVFSVKYSSQANATAQTSNEIAQRANESAQRANESARLFTLLDVAMRLGYKRTETGRLIKIQNGESARKLLAETLKTIPERADLPKELKDLIAQLPQTGE